MSRGPTTFRQRDVAAAIRAAKAAGCTIVRVEIGRDGKVILVLANAETPPAETASNSGNEWDALLK
jgi:hypothetical protein